MRCDGSQQHLSNKSISDRPTPRRHDQSAGKKRGEKNHTHTNAFTGFGFGLEENCGIMFETRGPSSFFDVSAHFSLSLFFFGSLKKKHYFCVYLVLFILNVKHNQRFFLERGWMSDKAVVLPTKVLVPFFNLWQSLSSCCCCCCVKASQPAQRPISTERRKKRAKRTKTSPNPEKGSLISFLIAANCKVHRPLYLVYSTMHRNM